MCNFLSAISDKKVKVLFFKVEDVVKIMCEGNKKNYNFNSHTSIADYFGVKPKDEDKYAFWEYNPDKKELVLDRQNKCPEIKGVEDKIKKEIEKYFKGKDIIYLRNLYTGNSGNRNSGNRNSGNRNSAYMNSGDMNSGNMNSGDMNSGNRNSGNRNSGNWNSGDMNSGNWNSGDMNSGNGVLNYFCEDEHYLLFDKKCNKKDVEKVRSILINVSFNLCNWVYEQDMTEEEKEKNTTYKTTGGYLKVYTYQEMWQNALKNITKEQIKELKSVSNFNSKKFFRITGVKI